MLAVQDIPEWIINIFRSFFPLYNFVGAEEHHLLLRIRRRKSKGHFFRSNIFGDSHGILKPGHHGIITKRVNDRHQKHLLFAIDINSSTGIKPVDLKTALKLTIKVCHSGINSILSHSTTEVLLGKVHEVF